jgi:uroporphyrinogen decarboxylase
MRNWKKHSGVPEHVDFAVKDRKAWEEMVRPQLLDESLLEKRIPFEEYRTAYANARAGGRYIVWHGVNVFECMHPVCGHEYMLMGMALDPEWIIDMCDVFANLTMKCQQLLFEREGYPDGIWFYEDMGFKERPFMSPAMYDDIIKPFHKKTFDYAHSIGCKVIVHSCGYVEPLIPGLIEAGMDCLQAMEVKAGMDLLKIQQKYGEHIALMGGLDVRVLETNDLAKVDALIETKVKPALEYGGYIIYSDHSIPQSVEYDTYKYFLESARRLEVKKG